jgi:type II secretory pathway component PulM
MKLGKDEIQKMILGALLALGIVYGYFTLLLWPLQARQVATQKSIEALQPEISKAKAEVIKVKAVEEVAPKARATVAQVDAMIPEGSPVAWFPPRLADFFKWRGVDRATTRMNSESAEKELPGFRRLSWGVDLPKVEFIAFAAALAQLENEEPLLEITSIQIEAGQEEITAQRAMLTVSNLVKQ